ncbi:hypothetical protein BKA70DRAFT_886243 [Coprinopsis sp. MPI-PUGE-AT-0042]|nr:hypothetical protein BKA70DRAFT_886243 [Coprinopsis sp. MPI-PUGE-AT-0042]
MVLVLTSGPPHPSLCQHVNQVGSPVCPAAAFQLPAVRCARKACLSQPGSGQAFPDGYKRVSDERSTVGCRTSASGPKRRFSPTTVGLAARAAASPIFFSGSIRIRTLSGGAPVGWVGNAVGGLLVPTTNLGERLPLSFTYVDSATFVELNIQDNAQYRYVGVAASTLGAMSSANGFIVRSNSVPLGPPMPNGHSAASPATSETFIWKFDPSTNELTATWTNPGGGTLIQPSYDYSRDSC